MIADLKNLIKGVTNVKCLVQKVDIEMGPGVVNGQDCSFMHIYAIPQQSVDDLVSSLYDSSYKDANGNGFESSPAGINFRLSIKKDEMKRVPYDSMSLTAKMSFNSVLFAPNLSKYIDKLQLSETAENPNILIVNVKLNIPNFAIFVKEIEDDLMRVFNKQFEMELEDELCEPPAPEPKCAEVKPKVRKKA